VADVPTGKSCAGRTQAMSQSYLKVADVPTLRNFPERE